jgi:uncharacterized repeat protein (TIGR01451 family)
MNRYSYIWFLVISLFVCSFIASPVVADEYGNISQKEQEAGTSSLDGIVLPFDPNDYDFLVYDSEAPSERSIIAAMELLGINLDSNSDIRGPNNEVTLDDLANHDILIVGWNAGGDTTGLNSNILAAGITGRIVLSGHDLDYHTIHGPQVVASTVFVQAMDFVLQGEGTGMITLGCTSGFPYLPSDWGVSASVGGSEVVTEFTIEGLESGIFDGVEPIDMCYWGTSYHNTFTVDTNSTFLPFELGGDGDDIITVASYKLPLMSISKVDDVGEEECVQPDDEITYTITFFPDESDHTNVYVTDYLPLEVEFISADPNDGEYNDEEGNRTYTWYIGDVDGGDPSANLELVVRVTSAAEPLGVITNKVEIESDTSYTQATETTNVCCWDDDNDIIYVDSRATGFNTGTCWDDAYVRLESALARAGKGCGDEIWVAGGWYYPTTDGDVDKSFAMVGGVGIYGGFKGDEVGRGDRNYGFYKTYLSGDIDPDGPDDSTSVVRADEITSLAVLVLDGFIITGAAVNGFDCNDASPVINHCLITQNASCGLYSTGSGCPTLSHSVVRENGMGIDCGNSTPIIVNNWIHHNYGIGVRAGRETVIRNNTIVHNDSYGVSNCANDDPQVVNCILWHNNSENGYHQLEDCDADYCCITHPTNIAGDDPPPTDPNNNIYYNPLFAYSDPNLYNFHLDPESPCIEMGYDDVVDPQGETDIDGDDRIFGDHVDMGADEVNCDDVYDEWDLNADGTINLHEFSGMADAWLKKDKDPNWIDTYQKYDLFENRAIEPNDLNALVCYEDDEKWLWQACWFSSDTLMMMGMDGGMDKAMAAAPMTDEQIEQAKLDKWYTTRPPHVMTVWEEIKLVEESLDWLEKVWLEDEQLRKAVGEEEWKEFINSLYDWLAQMKEQSAK